MIFDEPFSGFDPINANLLKQEILSLKEKGHTIIFSTHNMASVEELCDNIALIDNGKTILNGSLADIKNQFKPNIFEMVFAKPFNKMELAMTSNYDLLSVDNQKDGSISTKVKLRNGFSTNEVLKAGMKAGNLISFNEIIPSMDDIFIEIVQRKQQKVEKQ